MAHKPLLRLGIKRFAGEADAQPESARERCLCAGPTAPRAPAAMASREAQARTRLRILAVHPNGVRQTAMRFKARAIRRCGDLPGEVMAGHEVHVNGDVMRP
jgi:hypothetical protein